MTVLGEFLPDGSDGLDDRKGAKEVATTLTIFLTKGHLRRLEQVQIPVWCYSKRYPQVLHRKRMLLGMSDPCLLNKSVPKGLCSLLWIETTGLFVKHRDCRVQELFVII